MKAKHSFKKLKIMRTNFIEIPELSEKLTELFNRPYHFYKNIVYFCEEITIDRYKNVQFIVNTDDHSPLHFHIETTNPDGAYKVFLDEKYSIVRFDIIYGKRLPKRIIKTINCWYEEQDGKRKVLEELRRVGMI